MDNTTLGYSSTIAERLNSKLVKMPSGCIEFHGARTSFGYGRIGRGGRESGNANAHRVAWELEHGSIPDGLCVLHACDNPPCCNVEHLSLGTLSDNTQDMLAKSRHRTAYGLAHGNGRLTTAQVQELRRAAVSLGNYAEAGRLFGISKQHARAICLGTKRRVA